VSRTGEEEEVPPKFDEEGNPVNIDEGSKSGASNSPTLEDLMKRLENLKAENKKVRAKEKKTKVYSSSNEDSDSEEEVSKKGRKGRNPNKPSYNSMSFNYINMPSFTACTSILVGKALRFDGTNYNQWKYCMKNYLYYMLPEVWQIVCDGVDFLDDDEQPTLDQL
jgi:hypothetical protein